MQEAETRRAERHFADFVRQAWHLVESAPLQWNWSVDAVCEHLEAVTAGQIKTLVINMPPGCMKSSLLYLWNAWEWTTRPELRYLCASTDQTLSTRDMVHVRDVVQSRWYRDRWPTRLRLDQNQKTRFDTTAGGWRIGTSLEGRIIGEHPHRRNIDDPHKITKTGKLVAVDMLSEADLAKATHWASQALSTRGMALHPSTVLAMQRLHQKDLSAYLLAMYPDAVHLCLTMKYEPGRVKGTKIGWTDPRTVAGELLWPAFHTPEAVADAAKIMGSWGEASQFQQRPAPKGGAMFQTHWFKPIAGMPKDVEAVVRFWDVAGTEEGDGPRTASVKMALTKSGLFIIMHATAERLTEAGVDAKMKQTAVLDGVAVEVVEEKEPGSSGKAVIAGRQRSLKGFIYKGVAPNADKVTRARPFRAQGEAGNVRLLVPPGNEAAAEWARQWLDEIGFFPFGALKDLVDATTGAFNHLALGEPGSLASLDDGAEYPLYH